MLTYPHFAPHFKSGDWTLGKVLEHQARTNGDRPFLQWTHEGAPLSFADVNRTVNRVAHGFLKLGISKPDRVIIFLPNCLEFIFAWFGLNKIGAVEAPINSGYKGEILRHQVNFCGADTIIVASDLLPQLQEGLSGMPKIKRVIVWHPAGRPAGELPSIPGIRVLPFDELYDDDESDPGIQVEPRDLASILFTSGTTGPSKGVMMPHCQLYFFAEQDVQMMSLTSDDVYMAQFPLFHGNAQFLSVYPSLIAGARCVVYERFSASEWLQRVRGSGATVANAIGATMGFVLAQDPTPHDCDHKLRLIYAAPTPTDMLPEFRKRFGNIRFTECFGQTEICLPFIVPPGVTPPRGSVGVLVDQWFEIQLVDSVTDEEVPLGGTGELIVRPKTAWLINQGYSNMPDKTAEACRNLWFHTGDGMRQDEQGWYYFVDRMKDALRRRGENISSHEVESPIRQHAAVADVAVVAAPAEGEASEDEVKVFIVLREGQTLTVEELMAWCEPRLPRFVIPRFVEFLPDLPRTQSEKVQKAELRKMGNTEVTWDRVRAGYRFSDEAAAHSERDRDGTPRDHHLAR